MTITYQYRHLGKPNPVHRATEPATAPIGQEAPENAEAASCPHGANCPHGFATSLTCGYCEEIKAVNSHHTLWARIRKVEWDNNIAAARITHLEDLARNVAGLDINFLASADLDRYRALIIEWRNQAQELMK